MKRFLLLLLTALCATLLQAQEVIATSGDYYENTSGSLSWTISESVSETFENTNNILTQGFHQSRLTVTSINEITGPDFVINAFPNPAAEFVTLKVDSKKTENLWYKLFDINGELLLHKKVKSNETEIPFSSYAHSTYFVKVLDNSKVLKIFKIVKK